MKHTDRQTDRHTHNCSSFKIQYTISCHLKHLANVIMIRLQYHKLSKHTSCAHTHTYRLLHGDCLLRKFLEKSRAVLGVLMLHTKLRQRRDIKWHKEQQTLFHYDVMVGIKWRKLILEKVDLSCNMKA